MPIRNIDIILGNAFDRVTGHGIFFGKHREIKSRGIIDMAEIPVKTAMVEKYLASDLSGLENKRLVRPDCGKMLLKLWCQYLNLRPGEDDIRIAGNQECFANIAQLGKGHAPLRTTQRQGLGYFDWIRLRAAVPFRMLTSARARQGAATSAPSLAIAAIFYCAESAGICRSFPYRRQLM
jgi:hypothetical protein